MRKNALKFLVLTLIGIMIYSCQNENDFTDQLEEPINLNEQDGLKKMVLGKKLENPYSVENMKKALNNLKQSKSYAKRKGTSDNLEITTTHLYIRFKPVNEEELNLIERDTTLILFDYPLDYEVSEEGDFYQDPEIPDELPTYQYTYVELDKKLPNVSYEIISNLYLPYDENEDNDIEDEDTVSKSTFQLNEKNIANLLEQEALKITGNLEQEENSNEERCWFCSPSKWQPKGKITLWDTTLRRYIGVEGVKIRAGRWFKWRHAITKADGSYAFASRFRRKVRYKMDWERYDFALRSGGFSSAQYRGPYKKGNWDWSISSGVHQYYAHIFRAAHHYYYKDNKGLKRPKQNSFWRSKLRIGAWTQDKGDTGGVHQSGSHFGGLVTGIKIYRYGAIPEDIYATTIHELAHSSHYELLGLNFFSVSTKVKESWARGVQWELTRMVYPNYKGGKFSKGFYTTIVSDLIDDDFESISEATSNGYIDDNDQVSGWTIRQLEYSLENNTRSWNDWRDRLIGIKGGYDYNNNITRLFAAYE